MAKKAFEMHFQIGGKLASSFSNVFSKATRSLGDLKNEARQTQRALDQLGNDFRKGKIHQSQYAESTERLTRELERLDRAQDRINAMHTTFGNGVDTVRTTASIAAVGTAAAAAGIAFKSMDTAGSFQQQMAKVGVIAGASAEDMKRLNDTALELGASSSLSASEVAVAMKELASKGMDSNKVIGAMPGILAAAEASGEDLAMTSSVVVSALNAFELKASEASHVADVMAMSANKSAAGVEDLGYAFKYAAPIAKTLGVSLEELATATGVMVDKGLSGEQAGTSLRMALIRLSKPPKEAKKALDKLGVSVVDKNKKFKSLAEISEEWNKATKKLTDTQKVQYAATVFGTEAATGMLNLFSAGPDKIDAMTKSLENSTGAAAEAAKAMKDNYAGSLEELKGSIETAQIKFATPILPVFQELFDGIGATLDDKSSVFERAGQKVAAGLSDIFDPFSTQKPIMPVKHANPEIHRELLSNYQSDLAKYNKFKGMDFGDKVVYSLDEATVKIEQWLSGSGGESMNKIFVKLGEIAGKAWIGAFQSTVSAAGSNLMQGNIAASLGLGAAAWMMGGGLLVRGAIGAGKWGYDKVKGSGASNGASPSVATSVPNTPTTKTTALNSKNAKVIQFPSTTAPKPTMKPEALKSILGKSGNVLGKAALPLTLLTSAYQVYKSNDKKKAIVQEGSGIAGGLAGAKGGAMLGAAVGSIVPGLGTAIGAVIGTAVGGIGGYFGGKWLGGKAVDKARQASTPAPQTSDRASATTASLNQSSAKLIDSFNGIKTSADKVKSNLDLLTMYTGRANGWLASLNNIQTAGQKVVKALENLETRINNVQLPGVKSRVGYNG